MVHTVFQSLFTHFTDVIQEMPADFDSHQFILQLAQEHQGEYIDALAAYRETEAPFKAVHSILARHLEDFVPQYIIKTDGTINEDIFGDPCSCATWQKMN